MIPTEWFKEHADELAINQTILFIECQRLPANFFLYHSGNRKKLLISICTDGEVDLRPTTIYFDENPRIAIVTNEYISSVVQQVINIANSFREDRNVTPPRLNYRASKPSLTVKLLNDLLNKIPPPITEIVELSAT